MNRERCRRFSGCAEGYIRRGWRHKRSSQHRLAAYSAGGISTLQCPMKVASGGVRWRRCSSSALSWWASPADSHSTAGGKGRGGWGLGGWGVGGRVSGAHGGTREL